MTVETQTNTAVYTSNGVAVTYPFNFYVIEAEHLFVSTRNPATDIVVPVSQGAYVISGLGNENGGSIEFNVAVTEDYEIIIQRIVPYEQQLNLINQSGFYLDTLEEQLDLTVMQIQQLAEQAGRAVKVAIPGPGPTLGETEPNSFLGTDADGNWIFRDGTGGDPGTLNTAAITHRDRSAKDRLDDRVNLRDYGANANNDAAHDCYLAVLEAMDEGFTVMRMTKKPGESNIAYFSQFPSTTTFVGLTFEIEPGILVSLPDKNSTGAQNSQGIRWANYTDLYSRDLDTVYTVDPQGAEAWYGNGRYRLAPPVDPLLVEHCQSHLIAPASLTPIKIEFPAGITYSSDTASATVDGRDLVIDPAVDGDDYMHVAVRDCQPGDEFVVAMTGTTTATPLVGIVLHDYGYAGLKGLADNAAIPNWIAHDFGGAAVDAPLSVLGPGTHASYSPIGAIWSVRIDDWNHYSILLNGNAMLLRQPTSGMIRQFGYGMIAAELGQASRIQEPIRKRGNKARQGVMVSMITYGDSLTALRYDAWTPYFQRKLDLSCGIRLWKMTNKAVGGQGIDAQAALLAADKLSGVLGSHNECFIGIGTNDIQGQTGAGNFYTKLYTMVTDAESVGCRVTLGIPALWYTRGQAGPRGQDAQNYELGAYYRMLVYRVGAELGCAIHDPLNYEGPILAHYVDPNLGLDLTAAGNPVKDDNIHNTTVANKLFIDELANLVAAKYTGPKNGLYLPLQNVIGTGSNGWKSGASEPLKASISQDGLVQFYGLIEVDGAPTRTDGTVVYTLPNGVRPLGTVRYNSPARSHNSDDLTIIISTAGEVIIFGAVASTYFDMSRLSYVIENREPFI